MKIESHTKFVAQLGNIYKKNPVEIEIVSFEIDTQYGECHASLCLARWYLYKWSADNPNEGPTFPTSALGSVSTR